MLLSLTQSLLVFYLLFCTARMNWAGPFHAYPVDTQVHNR